MLRSHKDKRWWTYLDEPASDRKSVYASARAFACLSVKFQHEMGNVFFVNSVGVLGNVKSLSLWPSVKCGGRAENREIPYTKKL